MGCKETGLGETLASHRCKPSLVARAFLLYSRSPGESLKQEVITDLCSLKKKKSLASLWLGSETRSWQLSFLMVSFFDLHHKPVGGTGT